MSREFVALITIKPQSGFVDATEIKLQLERLLKNQYEDFRVNDVKEFEIEETKKGTKYNFVGST